MVDVILRMGGAASIIIESYGDDLDPCLCLSKTPLMKENVHFPRLLLFQGSI